MDDSLSVYPLNIRWSTKWKLIPFLDYCTDLIFLRRVGGGYIFIHRLLMEHFAAMDKEEESGQRIRNG